jgi:hypothetical protein
MDYDVAEGSFPFHRTKKPFSIFEVPKMGLDYELVCIYHVALLFCDKGGIMRIRS